MVKFFFATSEPARGLTSRRPGFLVKLSAPFQDSAAQNVENVLSTSLIWNVTYVFFKYFFKFKFHKQTQVGTGSDRTWAGSDTPNNFFYNFRRRTPVVLWREWKQPLTTMHVGFATSGLVSREKWGATSFKKITPQTPLFTALTATRVTAASPMEVFAYIGIFF